MAGAVIEDLAATVPCLPSARWLSLTGWSCLARRRTSRGRCAMAVLPRQGWGLEPGGARVQGGVLPRPVSHPDIEICGDHGGARGRVGFAKVRFVEAAEARLDG
jgi:hypothetical protein